MNSKVSIEKKIISKLINFVITVLDSSPCQLNCKLLTNELSQKTKHPVQHMMYWFYHIH